MCQDTEVCTAWGTHRRPFPVSTREPADVRGNPSIERGKAERRGTPGREREGAEDEQQEERRRRKRTGPENPKREKRTSADCRGTARSQEPATEEGESGRASDVTLAATEPLMLFSLNTNGEAMTSLRKQKEKRLPGAPKAKTWKNLSSE
ncbi:hypothetical protein NDU88_003662 [Pleurodeles waltl]|uniref:Uncharacterized protein n=1 Tax=Pleurodeles waltl TaxID=8319 RepID=A0AAV7M9G1_PLEWA|nr:hypothetical protein NDU88_003662 [Pleurodeles waltl]